MTAYANVNGEPLVDGIVHVPNVGPWWADVVFEVAPDLSGAVVLNLGGLALSGTIDPTHDGTFGDQRRSRIVAGGGGWGSLVPALHYHNDAGVRALAVAQDAARIAGETLGTFEPGADAIGVDYVRESGPASRVLEDVIGAVAWWVGYDGVTVVSQRSTAEADPADYQILDFEPAAKVATVAIDDFSKVGVGSILEETLDAPLTVFELEIRISAESSRTTVWGGGTAAGRGRLAGLLADIAKRVALDRLWGKYRFRVVRMSGVRVELQAVAQIAGLPDVIPLSMKPGVAGAHAKLAGGSIVIVEFIEGLRTMPIVSAFAGKGEEGDAPDELDFSVTTTLRLGSDGASEGVTLGDSHKSWADGHTHDYINDIASGTGVTSTPTPAVTDPPTSAAPSPSAKVKVDA